VGAGRGRGGRGRREPVTQCKWIFVCNSLGLLRSALAGRGGGAMQGIFAFFVLQMQISDLATYRQQRAVTAAALEEMRRNV
jgi:hypothetical protein